MLIDQFTTTAIAAGTDDTAAVAAAVGTRLIGYSVKESAGSPDVAELNLRVGTTDTGTIVCPINLAASGSDTTWYGVQGIPVDAGIFVERVSGNSSISLFTIIM